MTPIRTLVLALSAAVLGSACAPRAPGTAPGPQPPEPELPPIPSVSGPLELRVSYPRDSAFVATRGPNFIFGSTGNGAATLRINGEPVEVQPNGGFLAFIPVPDDSVYRLRAQLAGETATLEVPIRIPPPAPEPTDSAVILAGTAYPVGGWVSLPDERIEVGFRGTAGGAAALVLPDGERIPLVEAGAEAAGGATDFEIRSGGGGEPRAQAGEPAFSSYRGFFTARRLATADTTVYWPALTVETRPSLPTDTANERRELEAGAPLEVPGDTAVLRPGALGDTVGAPPWRPPFGTGAWLELVADGQTVRQALPFNLLLSDPLRPRVGVAFDPDEPAQNGDGAIIARLGPGGGPYHYFWENGTEMTLTGERNGIYRVRLSDDLSAWSPSGDIQLRDPAAPPPSSRVATVRMDPQPAWIDVNIALDRRLPYRVEEGDRSLSVLVYGAISRANFLQHGRMDPYIVRGEWSQPSDAVFRVDVHLAALPWGYEAFWGEGDDLVLRIRRPPTIDQGRPLAGLTVGVDPGHGGADRFTMGPTGFTEADANLGISLALRDELRRQGARVVMTRTTDTTVSLVERTEMARQEDVHLWISVHNNAFPDGVDPWENNGTSVYYNHPRSSRLAWAVHRELLDELGLRDLGVGRADLHQARFAWAPAILTENAFMMIPEQEAALKRDDVQERIARAHVRGLAEWLRLYARGDLVP